MSTVLDVRQGGCRQGQGVWVATAGSHLLLFLLLRVLGAQQCPVCPAGHSGQLASSSRPEAPNFQGKSCLSAQSPGHQFTVSRHGSCFRQDGLAMALSPFPGSGFRACRVCFMPPSAAGIPEEMSLPAPPIAGISCLWSGVACGRQPGSCSCVSRHRPPSPGTVAGVPGRLSGMEYGGAGAPWEPGFCLPPNPTPPHQRLVLVACGVCSSRGVMWVPWL